MLVNGQRLVGRWQNCLHRCSHSCPPAAPTRLLRYALGPSNALWFFWPRHLGWLSRAARCRVWLWCAYGKTRLVVFDHPRRFLCCLLSAVGSYRSLTWKLLHLAIADNGGVQHILVLLDTALPHGSTGSVTHSIIARLPQARSARYATGRPMQPSKTLCNADSRTKQ